MQLNQREEVISGKHKKSLYLTENDLFHMKPQTEWHIHVNSYSQHDRLKDLELRGFKRWSCFKLKPEERIAFDLLTYKVTDRSAFSQVWTETLSFLNKDPAFSGYVEAEVVPLSHVRSRSRNFCSLGIPFPIFRGNSVEARKRADIHVFRDTTMRDMLDEQLLDTGFYEVQTPKGRIFTIQTASVTDAKIFFQVLDQHLSRTGGVRELCMEIVTGLIQFGDISRLEPVYGLIMP